MSKDAFAAMTPSLESPATMIEAIIPDDEGELVNVTRAINVETSGVVRMVTVDGAVGDVFIVAGATFPVRARRVLATGTTATGIRGLA